MAGDPPTSNSFIRSKNCPWMSPHTENNKRTEIRTKSQNLWVFWSHLWTFSATCREQTRSSNAAYILYFICFVMLESMQAVVYKLCLIKMGCNSWQIVRLWSQVSVRIFRTLSLVVRTLNLLSTDVSVIYDTPIWDHRFGSTVQDLFRDSLTTVIFHLWQLEFAKSAGESSERFLSDFRDGRFSHDSDVWKETKYSFGYLRQKTREAVMILLGFHRTGVYVLYIISMHTFPWSHASDINRHRGSRWVVHVYEDAKMCICICIQQNQLFFISFSWRL